MTWDKDQEFEKNWWGDCCNSYTEEVKQLSYGYKMGLQVYANAGKWPCYNLAGKSVLDIGGGPVSMLLKCENRGGKCMVIDPCNYPAWITARYTAARISYYTLRGEDNIEGYWDEVWIYNVLQHTEDPELIVRNARTLGSIVRLFEWIDIPPHEGHPQELKEADLNKWLDGEGTTEWLDENGCYGRSYYGVFEGVK